MAPPATRHVARSDAEYVGNKPAQGSVGRAFEWCCADARLEDAAAVRTPFGPFDGVTTTAGRQAHVDDDAIRVAVHGGSHSSSVDVGKNVKRDHVANEDDDQKQDHRRNIDAAEIGRKSRIGRSAGSVIR